MISYNTIKEINKLINAGLGTDVIANIFNISEKKIKILHNKTKNFSKFHNMDEEDTTTGGNTGNVVQPEHSTWDSGVVRGHANPIDQHKKWDSGVTRGKANPLN